MAVNGYGGLKKETSGMACPFTEVNGLNTITALDRCIKLAIRSSLNAVFVSNSKKQDMGLQAAFSSSQTQWDRSTVFSLILRALA